MDYNLITARPEAPVTEEWNWTTDLTTAYDGTEDALPLLRYPKRSIMATYAFETDDEVRSIVATMFSQFDQTVRLPLFQYMVKLKAAVAAGASSVSVNAERSDLREGYGGLLIEGNTFEEVVIDAITSDTVTFVDPIANSYSKRALLCPMTEAYLLAGPTVTRKTVDRWAAATFNFREYAPVPPFVNPLNDEALTMYDGLPVLEEVPTGTDFETILNTGTVVNEFIGIPDIFRTWAHSKLTFNLNFLCQRTFDLAAWERWVAFADYCQGSMNPFLLPTNRDDLSVVTPVAGGGNQVVVAGDLYSANYWGKDAFSRIRIQSDAGTHYAKVTAIGTVGSDDRLTFTPALPGGAGWNVNQRVSFLLKLRNANDAITCRHEGLQTTVSFSARTVA